MVFESSSSSKSNTNMDIDAGPAVILPEHHQEQAEQQEQEEEEEENENVSLRIPIQSSSSNNNNNNGGEDNRLFIEIFPEEIVEASPTTLLQVLKDECANNPGTWADAALCYMQQGKGHARDALTILEHACELPSVTSNKSHHVRILAATGIAHLSVANLQHDSHVGGNKKGGGAAGSGGGVAAANAAASHDPKNDLRTLADAKFTNAAKLDTFWPMTWIGRGMLNLEKLQIDQARFFFQTTEKQCGPVIPALLGMAAVLFSEGDYKGAQQKYEAAIRRYPRKSGAAARVGFGLCCYKLDQVDRAKAAFRRALDMEPENVEAMVSTALLDMASLDHSNNISGGDLSSARDFHARTEKAIKMMSMANLLDHSNAMVQNHLANHYFWKWTPVAGTVKVTPGSNVVVGSQNLPLDPGERIRIGNKFETTVVDYDDDDEDDNNEPTSFRISNPWIGTGSAGAAAGGAAISTQQQQPTENLKVWKKDYDRVIALAKGAYNSSSVDAVRGESLFFLARVYHVREEVENAHKFYERACKYAPDLAPARFGLAQTLIVKQEYEQAMKHLQLVLQGIGGGGGSGGGTSASSLNSSASTDALALLGLLQVRSSKTLTEGLANLRKAIELDPLNPDLVIFEALALRQHEANYPRALEQYKKAIDLKKRKNVAVPYDYYANCGVLCHETKQYDESLVMYRLALQAVDESASAAATRGQYASDRQARSTAATATLQNKGIERGRIRHVDNGMFTDFVDSLFQVVRPTSVGNKKVVQLVPTSNGENTTTSTTIDMSTLPLDVGDEVRLGKGLDSLIVQITRVDGDSGAIHVELKDEYDFTTTTPDENKDPDESAMQVDGQDDRNKTLVPLFVKRENDLLSIPEAISVAFNIARLHEAAGRTLAAVELHKAIVKRNPSYVNSYLRLACIAVDCGSLKESSQWLQIAAKTAPGNPEVLTLIGNLHLSLADWQPAQKVFDSLLVGKISSVEAYASLSLGNIYFATLHVSEKRYAKHLQYAADYYKRILGKDPANAFAANGLGTILAEKGEIFKAKEVFNRVREVSGDNIADSLVNLGHIFLAQKKHPEALQMYKSYMKRAEDGTTPITSKSRVDDVVEVLLYIAFAYFDWARHTELFNDSNAAPADGRYNEAMNYLQLAIGKHSKREVVLKYNLCMVKLQAANCVLQKLTRNIPRTVEEVQAALDGLQESLVAVEAIIKDKADGKKVLISSTTLQDFLKHCRANISSAESHLKDEKTRAESADEERRIRRLAAEAAQKELQLKVALEREEEAKKQELRDRKADAKMRQVQELQMGWQNEQSAEQEKKTKRTKGVPKAPDVEDEPGLEVDDDDDGQAGGGGRKRGLFDDSDDSDDDDAAATRPEAPPKKSQAQVASQQKDLFGDSDDSDDDDDKVMTKNDDADEAGGSSQVAKEDATEEAKVVAEATQGLFGDSSDEDVDDDGGESDEEIARADDNKKRGADTSAGGAVNEDGDQPAKKRRVLEDVDDDDE